MSIYLIRHGARFDKAHRSYWRKDFGGESMDPPLSALGFRMIAARAKQIKDDMGLTPLTIVTSPWLRCIQTANILASELSDLCDNTIHVDWRLAEQVKGAWFPEGKPQLQEMPKNISPMANDQVSIGRKEFNEKITFPESRQSFRGRVEACAKMWGWHHDDSLTDVILISHGMTQRWLALTLTEHREPKPGNPKVGQVYELKGGFMECMPKTGLKIDSDATVNVWPYIEG